MKCDKLKAMTVINAYQLECDDNELVYLKSEVDEAIAELKAEIENLKNAHDAYIGDLEDSHLEEITYLGMENYRLKEKLRKYKRMRAYWIAIVCYRKFSAASSVKEEVFWMKWHNYWADIVNKLKEKE